ncbi:class B sortase [Cohnella yongneupensis]|uniref:Class B sortase n=1 Tax=Cohnella yongneupensis TaxID=425006 RepID=A0ABW0R2Q1_9BACL
MRIAYAQWIRRGMLAIAAGVFLFSSYKVYAYVSDNYESKKTYASIKELYYAPNADKAVSADGNTATGDKQTTENRSDSATTSVAGSDAFSVSPKFKPLLEVNDEIVGWLRIADTEVDYPVTQTDDNEYYLTHDVKKEENITGSIFMDYRNNIKGYNRNTILYSHSMKNGTMFGAVLRYESRWNFENKPIIEFDTLYGDEKWEIFSAYKTDTSFDYIRTDFKSDEDFQQYLDTVKAMSLHKSDVEVSASDQILTLSTCYHGLKNGRFVVHAKLIRETKHPLEFDPVTGLWRPAVGEKSVDETLSLEPKVELEEPVATEETKKNVAKAEKSEKKPVKKRAEKPTKKPSEPKPEEQPATTGATETPEPKPAEQPAEATEQPKKDEVESETLTEVGGASTSSPAIDSGETSPAAEPSATPESTETAVRGGH